MPIIAFSASSFVYFFHKLFKKPKSIRNMGIIIKSVIKSQRDIDDKFLV